MVLTTKERAKLIRAAEGAGRLRAEVLPAFALSDFAPDGTKIVVS